MTASAAKWWLITLKNERNLVHPFFFPIQGVTEICLLWPPPKFPGLHFCQLGLSQKDRSSNLYSWKKHEPYSLGKKAVRVVKCVPHLFHVYKSVTWSHWKVFIKMRRLPLSPFSLKFQLPYLKRFCGVFTIL